MAKYKVCKPIEYGPPGKGTMYFPVGHFGLDQKSRVPFPSPKTTPSGCSGLDIPVDATGIIELPDDVAAELIFGQIAPLDDPNNPNISGYQAFGQALSSEHVRRGTEDKVTGPGGKEEWVSGAERQVSTLGTTGTMVVGSVGQ